MFSNYTFYFNYNVEHKQVDFEEDIVEEDTVVEDSQCFVEGIVEEDTEEGMQQEEERYIQVDRKEERHKSVEQHIVVEEDNCLVPLKIKLKLKIAYLSDQNGFSRSRCLIVMIVMRSPPSANYTSVAANDKENGDYDARAKADTSDNDKSNGDCSKSRKVVTCGNGIGDSN